MDKLGRERSEGECVSKELNKRFYIQHNRKKRISENVTIDSKTDCMMAMIYTHGNRNKYAFANNHNYPQVYSFWWAHCTTCNIVWLFLFSDYGKVLILYGFCWIQWFTVFLFTLFFSYSSSSSSLSLSLPIYHVCLFFGFSCRQIYRVEIHWQTTYAIIIVISILFSFEFHFIIRYLLASASLSSQYIYTYTLLFFIYFLVINLFTLMSWPRHE